MDINELIKKCFDGNGLLFVGAGFSANAINMQNDKIPTVAKFSKQLCELAGLSEESENLGYSSEIYEEKLGINNLISLINKSFSANESKDLHKKISSIHWRRIYTTNYDNVLEIAHNDNGIKNVKSVTTADDPERILADRGTIVHLNGYVNRLSRTNYSSEFRLSDTSYLIDQFTETPWSRLFSNDVQNCDVLVFLGYSSKYDYELKKVLYNSTVKYKTYFIVDPDYTNEEEKFTMNKFGEVIIQPYCNISEIIENEKINHKKIEYIFKYKSLRRITPDPEKLGEESATEVVNLFMNGIVNDNHIKNNLQGYFVQPYPIDCEKHKVEIDEWIKSIFDKYRIVIAKSELGNGKTLFLKILSYRLTNNYKVYYVENEDNIQRELDEIYRNNTDDDIILVIDDYNMRFKTLTCCKMYKHKIRILTSCRTHLNSNIKQDLARLTGNNDDDIIAVDINNLSHNEKVHLISIFDKYHLWGEKDFTSQAEKEKYLTQDCKGNYSNILLDLLSSRNIQEKIDEIYSDLRKSKQVYDFILASSVNKLCNLKIDYFTLCNLLNYNTFEIEAQIRKRNTLQMFNYKNSEYEVKSSIFSKFLCHKSENTNRLVELLIQMVKKAEAIELKNEFYNFKKFIISTSNLNLVLGTNKEGQITKFFEGILNIGDFHIKPYYWFQFAINLTNTGNYELAETYFANAYKYADKLESYDKYQLDTHYARFLFEKSLKHIVPEKPIQVFEEAHLKLIPNKHNGNNGNRGEKLYFSLKQVFFYKEFYNRYKNKLTQVERMNYLLKTKELLNLFDEYLFELKKNNNKLPYEVRKSLNDIGSIETIDIREIASRYPDFFKKRKSC